jgi:ParB/RepB/Spo0J family partition protein
MDNETVATEEPVQPALDGLHEDAGSPELMQLALSTLPNSVLLPDKNLVESVRKNGVLAAIVVMVDKEGGLAIIDGRRRVVAARENDMDTIPALVYPFSSLYHAMSLTTNNVRTENPVSDLDGILSLMATGYQETEIASELGIPVAVIRRRVRLSSLHPELMTGLQTLHIGFRLAEKIALLTKEQQEMLADRYREKERLTAADVKEIVDATTPESEKATQTTMSIKEDKDWRAALRLAISKARENGIAFEAFQAAMTAEYESDDDE